MTSWPGDRDHCWNSWIRARSLSVLTRVCNDGLARRSRSCRCLICSCRRVLRAFSASHLAVFSVGIPTTWDNTSAAAADGVPDSA